MSDQPETKKPFPVGAVIALLIFTIAVFKACDACFGPHDPPAADYPGGAGTGAGAGAAASATREARIKKQFSAWDGSHIALERWVKQNMNDPDSYEHIESSWLDNGDNITVMLKFRGANAFGGKVINVARCNFDVDGNMIGTPVTQ